MKVRCIDNHGFSGYEKSKTYQVYGLVYIKSSKPNFVISDDHIYLAPNGDFEIIDNQIPPNWRLNYSDSFYTNNHIGFESSCLLGYKELVESATHLLNLLDSPTPEDTNIFVMRKKEIDQWQKEVDESAK